MSDFVDVFCLRTAEDHCCDFGPRLQAMLTDQCLDWEELPPENDLGSVEYKWRLGKEHHQRHVVSRLATQMKFRVAEGSGTAYYLIGVRDSGCAEGLTPREHAEAVCVLMTAAATVGSVFLLEALSKSKRGGRRCSAWRVEGKQPALDRVAASLHLCGVEARSPKEADDSSGTRTHNWNDTRCPAICA